MFQKWADVDPVFENIALKFPGVRILKQDPVENLFSFICSSNNNIQRISGMYIVNLYFFFKLEILKMKYGFTIVISKSIFEFNPLAKVVRG